ncbi:hypothetical protein INT44_008662 [Umbelopsis vinacea]|uniref:Tubby C-terminal domain-containing protein n=1 Tax=Umbelopsis vinacea TaxID=44442 RepID=A0A8H7PZ77_9FUNG|nr:hypothetical protein INT44_008662 [Umbelopsis vinacea]
MKQSVTAPPPRSWSQTEGYVEPQKDDESTGSPMSSGGAHMHNGHARRSSADSNYEEDARIGIDPSRTPEPLQLLRSTDFAQQNFEMNKEELCAFATKPADLNVRFTCRIQRHREGMDRLNPYYQLYFQNLVTNEVQWIFTANKKRKSQTSYYTIKGSAKSQNASNNRRDGEMVTLAKVRSNFLGTNFTVYSNGRNPNISVQDCSEKKRDADIREELGSVIYEPNILGFRGPRKMTVLLHTLSKTGERIEFQPTKESETLLAQHKMGEAEHVLALHNKSPQWNEETQSFVLNFNGRVTQASVKNFQIVHDNDLDYIVMQFGKIDQDAFTMDFRYPLSPVLAFAIALTSFDAKLACE